VSLLRVAALVRGIEAARAMKVKRCSIFTRSFIVTIGLDPVVHGEAREHAIRRRNKPSSRMDCRIKSGNDEIESVLATHARPSYATPFPRTIRSPD
jgi:hypothetical protein